MPPNGFATRRTFRERVSRLVKHPIQTIKESRANNRERLWNVYYAAAREAGQTETNARNFADQISKQSQRTRITKDDQSFLKPRVKLIRARQNTKEKIQLLMNENDQLVAKMRTPHLPKRKRLEIEARQEKVESQMDALAERLAAIENKIASLRSGKN